MDNIFENIPDDLPNELFEEIISSRDLKIERIVSKGQATAKGSWLEQDKDEWVILLKGQASLLIEGQEIKTLKPGDYIHIPAHCKHRVEWTDKDLVTVWLAIHYTTTAHDR